MSRPIIEVEALSKCYHLGTIGATSLRDSFARGWERLRGRAPAPHEQEFWALRDVSFSVQPGEVLGVIGRNGAGKSTLLKILSRITEPTRGRARLRGRVASLLEVGTGFHPELTGRENVFLNGAILGMSRAEVRKKFDEIVAFAEVEQFIDTPVKRYSSGMYVRLAFAVAAHLEPEILIVDEVLAVGDVEFQKKCLGKMQSVADQEGRTVLFVSHNMDAVARLCHRVVLLRGGRVDRDGRPREIIETYITDGLQLSEAGAWIDLRVLTARFGHQQARFVAAQYRNAKSITERVICSTEPIDFTLRIESRDLCTAESLSVAIFSATDQKLVNLDSRTIGRMVRLASGVNRIVVSVGELPLKPGKYHVGLWLAGANEEVFDCIERAFEIEVHPPENARGRTMDHDGFVVCPFEISAP